MVEQVWSVTFSKKHFSKLEMVVKFVNKTVLLTLRHYDITLLLVSVALFVNKDLTLLTPHLD